jgi:hypothetical protein
MAYCDTDDVNGILGDHAATSSSTPTLTQLGSMINGIASQIDVCLKSAGVASVPVTSAQDSTVATFLVEVNKWGAAAEFLKGMFPEATGPGENPAFAFWQKKYNDVLLGWKDKDGPQGIPASLLGGAGDADPSTYFTRNPNEEEELGDLQENMDRTRVGDSF